MISNSPLFFAVGGLWLAIAAASTAPAVERQTARPPIPAVVHSVNRSSRAEVINLDGPWDFAIDPDKRGETEQWFLPDKALPNQSTILVPGCWEAQGIGGPGRSLNTTPEVVPANLKGHYVGAAWYKRVVRIPDTWTGKQVWLKIGGVNSQGWFFVNGIFIGHLHTYCGAYKFNVTDVVQPGRPASVVALVRNDVPSAKGLMNWVHRFGGLYRSVELEATPALLIHDVYAEPEFDRKGARLHVRLGNCEPSQDTGNCAIGVRAFTLDGQSAGAAAATGEFRGKETVEIVVELPVDPFHPWSPEDPFLYHAQVVLSRNGKPLHDFTCRFGIRKWEVRGADFYLNNQRYFLRGYGDDYIYPLTLCSPASLETHRQHLQRARQFGFNFVRHHTHCEVPEFFEAADEVGLMVQPEMPYYGGQASGGNEVYRPRQDAEELVAHYRRYVSLANYCTGNEGQLPPPLDTELFQFFRQTDPSRIAIHQDGGVNTPDNSQYGTFLWLGGIGTLHDRSRLKARSAAGPGEIEVDYARPLVLHEYLNLATGEDPRLSPRYTGAIRPPRPLADYEQELAAAGLTRSWGDACLDAGQKQQSLWQKVGVEGARLDEKLDGLIYWTLVDVGYPTAQGLLNQFWEPKHSTPDFFRQFNSPAVLLAQFTPAHRILTEGELLRVQWFISNYAGQPVRGDLRWRLVAADDHCIAQGQTRDLEVLHGTVPCVATREIEIPALSKPIKARCIGQLAGQHLQNTWDVWLFPRLKSSTNGLGVAASPPVYPKLRGRYPDLAEGHTSVPDAQVLLSESLGAAELAALSAGKTVITLGARSPAPGFILGWWVKNAQTGTAIANRHPALAGFPTDNYLTPVFHRILGRTEKLGSGVYQRAEPLMVTAGSSGYLAHVVQAKVGSGKLLRTGLNLLSDGPEAAWLLDQFIRYVKSDHFRPAVELDAASLAQLAQAMATFNGYGRSLRASEQTPYASPLGPLPMHLARATDGRSEVVWETQPAPADLKLDGRFTFTWLGATGWITEPPGSFTLFLGPRQLVEFGVTRESKKWTSPDGQVQLDYLVSDEVQFGVDSAGTMKLSLPAAWLTPGKPAVLRVVGANAHSQRWFGLYHTE